MFDAHEIITIRTTRTPAIATARIVWKRRWLALATFLVAVTLTLIGCLVLTPAFEASALLVVDQSTLDNARGANRSGATAALLAHVAESEDVIRKAIDQTGLERLVGPKRTSWGETFTDLLAEAKRRFFSGLQPATSQRPVTALDLALPRLAKSLTIRPMPNSDIIRISFSHRDPVVAATFVNAVARAFVDRQLDLFSRPGVVAFYQRQKEQFEDDIRRASDALNSFSTSEKTYSIEDQKGLLLKRANEMAAALAATRGLIADKNGQREALTAQLRKLKPVTLSPFVASVVDFLGGPARPEREGAKAPLRRGSPDEARLAEDPPLLMVRVYQDTMVVLFKINAELNGLEKLEQEQSSALQELNGNLNDLSAKEAEFARLKRAVAQASTNSDTYVKRMVEEQVVAASNAAKFSALKILQQAYPPPKPSFPNYPVVASLGLVLGVLATLAIVLGVDAGLEPAQVEDGSSPRVTSSTDPLRQDAAFKRTRAHGRASSAMKPQTERQSATPEVAA